MLYTITIETQLPLDPNALDIAFVQSHAHGNPIKLVKFAQRHPYADRDLHPSAALLKRGKAVLMHCPACGETEEPYLVEEPTGNRHEVRAIDWKEKQIRARASMHAIEESGTENDVLQCGNMHCFAMYEVPEEWGVDWV